MFKRKDPENYIYYGIPTAAIISAYALGPARVPRGTLSDI
jgi:hypothetical protein